MPYFKPSIPLIMRLSRIRRWFGIIALSVVLFSPSLHAQESGHSVIPKTLYVFDGYGELNRYNEKEALFLITEERELYDENDAVRVDIIIIKKKGSTIKTISLPGKGIIGIAATRCSYTGFHLCCFNFHRGQIG